MALQTEMHVIALDELSALSDAKKAAGERFVQMHCCIVDDGVFDVIYSWMQDGVLRNYKIEKMTSENVIPSITNNFLAAFVFENEAHDLFGANIKDIAIDFSGHFYNINVTTPMAILSPAQKEAREKAAKIAAAKAAKEAKDAADAAPAEDDMEAKLAAMDPEKAAKVRAAMEAKKKKEEAAKAAAEAAALEEKLANMDPEKAAKVRAAMEAKAKKAAAAAQKEGE